MERLRDDLDRYAVLLDCIAPPEKGEPRPQTRLDSPLRLSSRSHTPDASRLGSVEPGRMANRALRCRRPVLAALNSDHADDRYAAFEVGFAR